MSRQDNFFLLLAKVCSVSWRYLFLYWYEVSIEFSIYSCSIMAFFFSLNIVFFLVGFFVFFLFICWRCFVCIYSFITLVSCSVYFGRAGSLGVSLAGRVIFSFCVGLRCVECRSGTIYLSVSLGWVAGLYRFFFSLGLCCGGYGTIEIVGGVVRFSLPSSVCCLLSR